jgi:benzoyl-CoA reductase/2-hydroxyglutaryl-CoA dehydratase subunit BcrC/BadD/HgdB
VSEAVQQGLLDRVSSIFGLVKHFPDKLSDEEVAGVMHALPPDLTRTIEAMMAARFRSVSIKFLKLIGTWMTQARALQAAGGKVFLVPFNFPPEIIYWFENAAPLTSEVVSTLGVAGLEGQGERYWDFAMGLGLPDFSCSANMIEVGSVLTSVDFKPDAIISDCFASCDINSKTHEFLARYMDIPLLFLEKPVDNGERGINQYYVYFEQLIREMEEFLGQKLDVERMRQVTEYANQASELYWELWDLHKHSPCPVPNIFALYTYGARFTMWGTPQAVDLMQAMVDLSRERLERGEYPADEERARAMWAYTAYYTDFKGFFNWMEENGITYLGDGLDLVWPAVIDTSSRETMIRGVAEIARNMPMTRQMGAPSMSAQWLDDLIWATSQLDANCVIYCGHHSCKQTWSGASVVRMELMKRSKLPMLILQGDSWVRRMTPMSVLQEQVTEFVNNVVKRKRK